MDDLEFDRLYRAYHDELLHSLQKRFLFSHDLVEDGVQEAFLRLHQAPTPPEQPRAWLRTVARNYVIDRLKEQGKYEGSDDVDQLPAQSHQSATTGKPTPSLVQRGLSLLTSRAQRLLRGKYQEDKTYGTLAREEGLAKSGMGRVLDRAREKLRRTVTDLKGRP